MSNEYPVEIDGVTGDVETISPQNGTGRRYRCRLDTAKDVRREMAIVYREARSGLIDVQDATKFTWCLNAIAKVIETSDIEKRVEDLEKQTISQD